MVFVHATEPGPAMNFPFLVRLLAVICLKSEKLSCLLPLELYWPCFIPISRADDLVFPDYP